MFYTVLIAWVIFTAKTSLNMFSLKRDMFSLDDRICEMKRVTESG